MKQARILRRVALVGALASFALATAGIAQTTAGTAISIHDAWTRPANPGVNDVGYLAMTNNGRAADRLVSAASPIAAAVSLHQSQTIGGVTSMRAVDGIAVPAGQTVVLAPGGFHLMFEGLKRPLKAGDHAPLTLTFAKAGLVRTEVTVRVAAPQPMSDMKM
jgi:hypothetical protein